MRGLDEHSLLKREAVWSSLVRILLPGESGVPGVGWKMVIFACFSGFFPPKTRVTQSGTYLPATRGRSLFPTTPVFPAGGAFRSQPLGHRSRKNRSRGHFN